MIFAPLSLAGAYLIEPEIFKDERGLFYRFFCEEEFKKINHTKKWVQFNHSGTVKAGTIRGMHFQLQPFSEIKMVKCIAGKIFDVIIDIREGSATFLKWLGVELSAENRKMLYIPEGFAHGFQTLTDDCELIYHHTAMYAPGVEGGLKYDDKMLGIQWPIPITAISERDKGYNYLQKDFKGI